MDANGCHIVSIYMNSARMRQGDHGEMIHEVMLQDDDHHSICHEDGVNMPDEDSPSCE